MTPTATVAPGAEAVLEEEEAEEASGPDWLPAGWRGTCSGTEEGRGTAGGTIAGGEEDTTGDMEGTTEAGEEEEDLGEVGGEEEEDGVVVEGLGLQHRRHRPLLPAPGQRLDSEAPGGDRRKKVGIFVFFFYPTRLSM